MALIKRRESSGSIKFPSHFADMSQSDLEYDGGINRKILGWILLIGGSVLTVAFIIDGIYGTYQLVKVKKAISGGATVFDGWDAEIFKSHTQTSIMYDSFCSLAGAGCAVGGLAVLGYIKTSE